MLSIENISATLKALSLDQQPLDSQKFVETVSSHVQAEPRTLDHLIPKLIEQVKH
jgi:hypothetical protein